MTILYWLLDRLKEPSTYAGFSGIALTVGLSAPEWAAISAAAAAIAGAVAVILQERKKA